MCRYIDFFFATSIRSLSPGQCAFFSFSSFCVLFFLMMLFCGFGGFERLQLYSKVANCFCFCFSTRGNLPRKHFSKTRARNTQQNTHFFFSAQGPSKPPHSRRSENKRINKRARKRNTWKKNRRQKTKIGYPSANNRVLGPHNHHVPSLFC